eukprot:TRINITY_DN1686_c0_g1_i2.p1 TRINITY_DN1686_c0_g1~~TRINITY_DN1686_c0_g1_i2.p1  ORF type:complete len:155 (+),score=80.60 TRINITY_DN1686_c0_g1_i2:26-466(+)
MSAILRTTSALPARSAVAFFATKSADKAKAPAKTTAAAAAPAPAKTEAVAAPAKTGAQGPAAQLLQTYTEKQHLIDTLRIVYTYENPSVKLTTEQEKIIEKIASGEIPAPAHNSLLFQTKTYASTLRDELTYDVSLRFLRADLGAQ